MNDQEWMSIDHRVESIISEIVNANAASIPAFTIPELEVLQKAMNLIMATNSEMGDGTELQLREALLLKVKTALNTLRAKQIMADGLREFHRELTSGTRDSDQLESTAKVVSRLVRDRIKRNGSIL
jgi:hypothetical protein